MGELTPLMYLEWRGLELSLVHAFETRGIKVFLIAIKHPVLTIRKLFEYALGVGKYRLAYICHPISMPRKTSLEKEIPLKEIEEVEEIESFKKELLKNEKIIPLMPTTIDELIYTTKNENQNLKFIIEGEGKDRWPLIDTPLAPYNQNISDYYKYPIDLTSDKFNILYKPKELKKYANVIKGYIEDQIVIRDYIYTSQSDLIIAYRPTMNNEFHSGMNNEIQMALSHGKPIYAYVPKKEEASFKKYYSFGFFLKGIRKFNELNQLFSELS